jgi:hypothetical protein
MGAQVFALAMALVVAAGFLVWQASNWRAWIVELPAALHLHALLPDAAAHSSGIAWTLVPVLATVALLGGVIVYLAAEKQ